MQSLSKEFKIKTQLFFEWNRTIKTFKINIKLFHKVYKKPLKTKEKWNQNMKNCLKQWIMRKIDIKGMKVITKEFRQKRETLKNS